MSDRLAMKIFNSALEPRLKALACLCALYADETGHRIWPSVGRLAWGLGISPRAVQMQLALLRRFQVLVPLTPLTGGGRSTEYRLQIPESLERPKFTPKGRTRLRGSDAERDEPGFVGLRSHGSEPTNAGAGRDEPTFTPPLNAGSPTHERAIVRSVSDRPEDPPDRKAPRENRAGQFRKLLEADEPKFMQEQRAIEARAVKHG